MDDKNKEIMKEITEKMEYLMDFYDAIALKHFNNDPKLYSEYSIRNVLPLLDNFMKTNRSDMNFAIAALCGCCLRFSVANMKNALGLENQLDQFKELETDGKIQIN